jgi:hypothetical protein
MSGRLFVSPATRLVAWLSKATKRPSAESCGSKLSRSPRLPLVLELTSVVVPAWASRTKMSELTFVSPRTRFEARLSKAMMRPSAEIAPGPDPRFAWAPAESTLTRTVVPV